MTCHAYLKLFLAAILFRLQIAKASFSLVATDAKTRQVGGVGATCLSKLWGLDVFNSLHISAPNRSVLVNQGWLDFFPENSILKVAKESMRNSTSETVLESMTEIDTLHKGFSDGVSFPLKNIRQYVTTDFESSACYTGSDLRVFWETMGYNDTEITDIAMMHGKNDRFRTHAAGNAVAHGTVRALQDGFKNSEDSPFGVPEDDLAGRLMSALQQVISEDGTLGDVRCQEEKGVSSSVAYIHIDNPDGTTLLHIHIQDRIEPVEYVAQNFLKWRAANVTSDGEWTYEDFGIDDDDELFLEDPDEFVWEDDAFLSLVTASGRHHRSGLMSPVLFGLVAVVVTII